MTPYVHQCRNIDHPFPIFAWTIMMVQGMNPFKKSSWSHMSMSIDGKYFDVTGEGCKEKTEEEFLSHYRIVKSHQIKADHTMVEFYDFFNIYRGREYDSLQITGLLMKGLSLITFNKLGHNLKKMICNELPVAYLKHFHKFTYIDSDNFDLIKTWKVLKRY